jgi:hypothetical protein
MAFPLKIYVYALKKYINFVSFGYLASRVEKKEGNKTTTPPTIEMSNVFLLFAKDIFEANLNIPVVEGDPTVQFMNGYYSILDVQGRIIDCRLTEISPSAT